VIRFKRNSSAISALINWRVPIAALLSITVVACAEMQTDDLEQFISGVKSRKPPQIEPLPEVKTFESFYYTAQDLRDPFTQAVSELAEGQTTVAVAAGLTPDPTRRREPLESFSLQELRMVAMMTLEERTWAAVVAPDGTVHRLQVGNYIGRNHGQVLRITETSIEMTEIVPDGKGGWQERDNVLAMVLEE
jgi:type IV pilus assembly protein PilP